MGCGASSPTAVVPSASPTPSPGRHSSLEQLDTEGLRAVTPDQSSGQAVLSKALRPLHSEGGGATKSGASAAEPTRQLGSARHDASRTGEPFVSDGADIDFAGGVGDGATTPTRATPIRS